MKIGASTLSIYGEKIEDNLEFFENLNLEYVEILHQYPCEEINLDILNSYNLKYTVHSPILDLNIASLNSTISKCSINDVKKSIDLANNLDSEIVIVHPGIIPFLSRKFEREVYHKTKESIKEIGNYANDLGVIATIENMPNIDGFIYKDIVKLDELLTNLEMSMTLDIGHACTTGFLENQTYFDSIKHIHLSDNFGSDDTHLALGEGSINFKAMIELFESKKYEGIYMIEVNDKNSVEKSLEYLKNLF
ncbi:sugar phosphate isomerase/epimerase [Methanobrevibacter sp. OttesenSCG-928-K11]|nr:sugar phosphate isomerase/epimerase [Methanobrevibacter sp. OttesenSCG-928-K11]MDL2271109.1 sugar phosphate isomerase/epimerase [Methanobrevibacter sp. OttesenSCG-928-I08]